LVNTANGPGDHGGYLSEWSFPGRSWSLMEGSLAFGDHWAKIVVWAEMSAATHAQLMEAFGITFAKLGAPTPTAELGRVFPVLEEMVFCPQRSQRIRHCRPRPRRYPLAEMIMHL
jgi:hypothetical protein